MEPRSNWDTCERVEKPFMENWLLIRSSNVCWWWVVAWIDAAEGRRLTGWLSDVHLRDSTLALASWQHNKLHLRCKVMACRHANCKVKCDNHSDSRRLNRTRCSSTVNHLHRISTRKVHLQKMLSVALTFDLLTSI